MEREIKEIKICKCLVTFFRRLSFCVLHSCFIYFYLTMKRSLRAIRRKKKAIISKTFDLKERHCLIRLMSIDLTTTLLYRHDVYIMEEKEKDIFLFSFFCRLLTFLPDSSISHKKIDQSISRA